MKKDDSVGMSSIRDGGTPIWTEKRRGAGRNELRRWRLPGGVARRNERRQNIIEQKEAWRLSWCFF
jgi:hypothetical protein